LDRVSVSICFWLGGIKSGNLEPGIKSDNSEIFESNLTLNQFNAKTLSINKLIYSIKPIDEQLFQLLNSSITFIFKENKCIRLDFHMGADQRSAKPKKSSFAQQMFEQILYPRIAILCHESYNF